MVRLKCICDVTIQNVIWKQEQIIVKVPWIMVFKVVFESSIITSFKFNFSITKSFKSRVGLPIFLKILQTENLFVTGKHS